MSEKRRWEYTRKGNIKTTSLHNARIALKDLDITGTYSRGRWRSPCFVFDRADRPAQAGSAPVYPRKDI